MTVELRKDLFADERDDNLNEIGQPTQRQDMLGHVTGRTKYFDDHAFDGLLHLKVLRSPHHHARIRRVDTSEAERSQGVRRAMPLNEASSRRASSAAGGSTRSGSASSSGSAGPANLRVQGHTA